MCRHQERLSAATTGCSCRAVLPAILLLAFCIFLPSLARAQKTSTEPSNAYGAGGRKETTRDAQGRVMQQKWYDPSGKLREDKDTQYYEGTNQKKSAAGNYYRIDGSRETTTLHTWDQNGKHTYFEAEHYDAKGNMTGGTRRDFEEATRWVWNPHKRLWVKVSESGGLSDARQREWSQALSRFKESEQKEAEKRRKTGQAPPQMPEVPRTITVVMPKGLPGERISGRVVESAKGLDNVPALQVVTLTVPVPLDAAATGTLEGVVLEGPDGRTTLADEGTVSLELPAQKVALTMIARQENDPQPAKQFDWPLQSQNISDDDGIPPPAITERDKKWREEHLRQEWHRAHEAEQDAEDAHKANKPPEETQKLDKRAADARQDADRAAGRVPPDRVKEIAKEEAEKARTIAKEERKKAALAKEDGEQTDRNAEEYHKGKDDYEKLKQYARDQKEEGRAHEREAERQEKRAQKLDKEAEKERSGTAPKAKNDTGFDTQPVYIANAVQAIRGGFGGDLNGTRITVDGKPVETVCETERAVFWRLPEGVRPGKHHIVLEEDDERVAFDVFVLILEMSADKLQLVKGESTSYHVRLKGLDGMPDSAWAHAGAPPNTVDIAQIESSSPGFRRPSKGESGRITLTLTNATANTIEVPDLPGGTKTFVLDRSFFANGGVFAHDGLIQSKMGGGFGLNGVAVAWFRPVRGEPVFDETPSGSGENVSTTPEQQRRQNAFDRLQATQLAHARAQAKLQKAWDDGIETVPKEIVEEYEKAKKAANGAWSKAVDAFGIWQKDKTQANKDAWDQAEDKLRDLNDKAQDAKRKVIKNMSKEKRQAYEKAEEEEQKAYDEKSQARQDYEKLMTK